MACASPGCKASAYAQGLCRPHYTAGRRDGSLQKVNQTNTGRCGVDGCALSSFAKGMCSKHYQQTRDRTHRAWKSIRGNTPGQYPAEWDREIVFIEVVGRAPSEKHQLRRINPDIPWSSNNFVWRPPVRVNGRTGLTADMAAYQRNWHYLRAYGLTDEDIAQMIEEQKNECPICQRPLERLHPDTGKPIRICLDHDHGTGVNRQFLCDDCNKALGMLEDDPARCRRAAGYLERHAAPILDTPTA